MPTLPTLPLTLYRTSQSDDSAAMSIIHNKNMALIEAYMQEVVDYIETLPSGSGSGGITTDEFHALLAASKRSVTLLVSMNVADTIDFDEYRLTKIGPVSGKPKSMEFRITDTNVTRNTNFRNSVLIVRTFDGETIYPTVVSTASWVSIQFDVAADIEPSTITPASDPNNKRITLL